MWINSFILESIFSMKKKIHRKKRKTNKKSLYVIEMSYIINKI